MKILKNLSIILVISTTLLSCGGGSSSDGIGYPARESRNGDWGYVNANGEVVIDFNLNEKPSVMTEGIGSYFKEKDKQDYIVYIDQEDNEYRTNYVQSLSFNEGLALVTTSTGKLTYIDKEYKEFLVLDDVIESGYFSDGLAKYKNKEEKWGFINKEGEKVIQAKYDYVESFIEGYAMVRNTIDGTYYRGIIDKEGREIIKLNNKYNKLSVALDGFFSYKQEDEVGFLNTEGEEVIKDDDWDAVGPFYDGHAFVTESRECGLIDKKGEYKIKIREDFPIILSEGLYVYKKDREYGYKNIEQEVIISAEFDKATPFFGNGAWVKDNKDWVYIDKKGKYANDLELYDIDLDEEEWFAMAYGIPPLDLEKTLESNFVDIDGFVNEVVQIDNNKIFGAALFSSNPEQVISYITSNNFLTEESVYDQQSNTKSFIKSKLSSRTSRISTYDLFGYSDYDRNFSYYLKYSFDSKLLQKLEGSTEYEFNNFSNVNRITFKIDLNNKAYGKDEEILEEIKEVLLSAGFEDDGTSISKYESGLYQEVDVRNSSGSILLDFTFSKVD